MYIHSRVLSGVFVCHKWFDMSTECTTNPDAVAQRDVMPGSFKRKISNWKSLVIQAASFKVFSKPQGFSVTQNSLKAASSWSCFESRPSKTL